MTYEPTTLLGILGLFIITAGVVAAATIPAWVNARSNRRIDGKLDKADRKLDKTVNQLTNGQTDLFRVEFTKLVGRVEQIHDQTSGTHDRLVRMEQKFDDHLEGHP